ncbi:MAG: hypothetical protein V2A74_11700, partial [bacterium]
IYLTMAVELAKQDPAKLASLVEHVDNLPPDARELLLEQIKSEEVMRLDEDIRVVLWNTLERMVSRHRRHPDAQWALPSFMVDEIEKAAETIAPKSLTYRFQRLFDDRDFELLDRKGGYRDQQERLEGKRRDAVNHVLQDGGFNAVITFARKAKSPEKVGAALGGLDCDSTENEILPALLLDNEKALSLLAEGYVWGRFGRCGWSWVESLKLKSWTPEQQGQFLARLPFMPETWERVSQFMADDESSYWKKTPANPFDTQVDMTPAIKRLVAFDRPNAAVGCIEGMLLKNQAIDREAAITALNAVSESSSDPRPIDPHAITHIIESLQEGKDVPKKDLAAIEWKFLSLLVHGHEVRPLTLECELAESASFFCEAVRAVYRSKNEDADAREPSEEEKARASSVFTLLFHWKYPPGFQEDGSFDGKHFTAWLSQVKTECTASGHLDVALVLIGHVLMHCPEDPDGLWLPHPVAEALNAPDAESMRNGFRTELINSRGAHFSTAGEDEKKLAEKYEQYAQAVEKYHRLAAELRKLADWYRCEAQRQSERDFD